MNNLLFVSLQSLHRPFFFYLLTPKCLPFFPTLLLHFPNSSTHETEELRNRCRIIIELTLTYPSNPWVLVAASPAWDHRYFLRAKVTSQNTIKMPGRHRHPAQAPIGDDMQDIEMSDYPGQSQAKARKKRGFHLPDYSHLHVRLIDH